MKAMPYGEGIKEKIALRIAEEIEQELLQKQIEEVEIYTIESMVFDKLIKYKQKNTYSIPWLRPVIGHASQRLSPNGGHYHHCMQTFGRRDAPPAQTILHERGIDHIAMDGQLVCPSGRRDNCFPRQTARMQRPLRSHETGILRVARQMVHALHRRSSELWRYAVQRLQQLLAGLPVPAC